MKKLIWIFDIADTLSLGTWNDRLELWKRINLVSAKVGSAENILCLATLSPVGSLKHQLPIYLNGKVAEYVVNPKFGRQFGSNGHIEFDGDNKVSSVVEYQQLFMDKSELFAPYIKEMNLEEEVLGVIYFDDNPSLKATDGSVEAAIGNIPYFCVTLDSYSRNANPNYIYTKAKGIKGMIEGLDQILLMDFVPYMKNIQSEPNKDMPVIYEFSTEKRNPILELLLKKIKGEKNK